MKDRIILFDLDGTLTDSAEGILKSVRIVLTHYGIDVPDGDDLHSFIGPPLRDNFRLYGVPAEECENAVKLYRKRYFSVGKFENRPYPGVKELLSRLRDAGCRMYVATSKPEDLAIEILGHFGLLSYFDRVAGASLDGGRDSKESVIAYLFREIGVTPEDSGAVMVGDTPFDVLGAKRTGLGAIAVSWGYGTREERTNAGASVIVDTMDELYDALLG